MLQHTACKLVWSLQQQRLATRLPPRRTERARGNSRGSGSGHSDRADGFEDWTVGLMRTHAGEPWSEPVVGEVQLDDGGADRSQVFEPLPSQVALVRKGGGSAAIPSQTELTVRHTDLIGTSGESSNIKWCDPRANPPKPPPHRGCDTPVEKAVVYCQTVRLVELPTYA